MRRDLKDIIARVKRAGWAVLYTGGGHLKLCPPQGGAIFTGSTPSDPRALRNLRAHLKRAGLAIE